MKPLGKVTLNGEQYVRYGDERQPALALFHVSAVDEIRGFNAMLANQAAPVATWEIISRSGGVNTSRLRVPGGWVVKHSTSSAIAQCFVPDTRHGWSTKIEGEA